MKPNILLLLILSTGLFACDQADNQDKQPAAETATLKPAEPVKSPAIEPAIVENQNAPETQVKPLTDTRQTVANEPENMGQRVYNKTCFTCHKAGAAGAPKVGDKAVWAPRIAKGIDKLMQSTINGVPGTSMVSRGTCFSCSDEELKAAIEYMISLSQ